MLTAVLGFRNRPQALINVDVRPLHSERVAGSHAAKNRELERARTDAGLLAKLHHEGGELGIGQRREVLDFADRRLRREQLIEVAFPSRRIRDVVVAIPLYSRPAQHALDALAQPRCGDGLCLPDRLQRPQHRWCVDRCDRHFAEDRRSVDAQAVLPRLAVRRTAPAIAVGAI